MMIHIFIRRRRWRRFSGEDAEALLAFLGDPEVNEFLPMFPLRDAAEAERYLR